MNMGWFFRLIGWVVATLFCYIPIINVIKHAARQKLYLSATDTFVALGCLIFIASCIGIALSVMAFYEWWEKL